eukprot:Partr_v1_DN25527_c2_g1_i1_m20895 putative Flotillin
MIGYFIANANELLAITGPFIKDVELTRKHLVLPFQRITRFKITPVNYEISIKAMSQEKLSFLIPASITVGPDVDDSKQLAKYVRLLVQPGSATFQEEVVGERVRGILVGELRAVTASMSIEEIYNQRKLLQEKVYEYISESLAKFGLHVYNANIKELGDKDGYFATMGMKASEAANSLAKVSVAESKAKGDIGAADRDCRAQRETSRMKSETAIYENERQQTVEESQAILSVKESKYNADVAIAKLEAQLNSEMKNMELQAHLEIQNATRNLETLRANELAKATVEAERIRQMADAKAYELRKEAEASMFEQQKIAEGLLFAKEREAEGLQQVYQAQAAGLQDILNSFGDPSCAMQFVMMEKDLFQSLAKLNAAAINDLEPELNIWTTDETEDTKNSMANVMRSLAPVLSTVKDQTGISPPQWMAQMPSDKSA